MVQNALHWPYPLFVVDLVRGVQDKSNEKAWPIFITVAISPTVLSYDELRDLFPEIGTDKFLHYLFEISIGFGMCGFYDCGEEVFDWRDGTFLEGHGVESLDQILSVWHKICEPQRENLRVHWKHEIERWHQEKVGDHLWDQAKDRLGIVDPVDGGLGRSFV